MERVVYIFRNEKGLYTKDKGRVYFVDRSFKDADEGFAKVVIVKEKETYGFISGEMLEGGNVDLNVSGTEMYRVGSSYWNICRVNGRRGLGIAWSYDGNSLCVLIDGKVYTDWGYNEKEIYSVLSKYPKKEVYVKGYWVKSLDEEVSPQGTIKDVLEVSEWRFDESDALYRFGDNIYMFDPMSGCMTNYGFVWGSRYKFLSCIETIDMWEFLCENYKKERITF